MAYRMWFVVLLFYKVSIPAASGQSGELCISPGGRFPPFSSEGKPPRKVAKGPRDLVLCRVFRQSTCCDIAQTYPALLSIRKLASSGEASQRCLHLWELLECSICHPQVGVKPGPPLICAFFCDMILLDCSSAYFSIDPKSQVLSPCGSNDIVCGRASEWASNGTELCHLAGFAVQQHDADEGYCYGGQASLESIPGSWKAARSGSSLGDQSDGILDDFRQWFGKLPANEKARWTIGGMMLIAGLFFVSKRKSYGQRQKQVAVLHAARRIEARVSHHSTSSRR